MRLPPLTRLMVPLGAAASEAVTQLVVFRPRPEGWMSPHVATALARLRLPLVARDDYEQLVRRHRMGHLDGETFLDRVRARAAPARRG